MSTSGIKTLAEKVVKKFKSRDPFYICKQLGVNVEFYDLGSLKGMYTVIKRYRFVVVNSECDYRTQKIVCAHELGHDLFHRKFASDNSLREFMIYDMSSRPEYEANVFASHVLLDEKDIIEYAKQGFDAGEMARMLDTDANLVLIKMYEMHRNGVLSRLPDIPKTTFLKWI